MENLYSIYSYPIIIFYIFTTPLHESNVDASINGFGGRSNPELFYMNNRFFCWMVRIWKVATDIG